MGISYKYRTPLSKKICLDYLSHNNVSDVFEYQWEETDGQYSITFMEYRNSILSLSNSPKPRFSVALQDLAEEGTEIEVQFTTQFLQPLPFVYTKDIHAFWKKKLNAEPI